MAIKPILKGLKRLFKAADDGFSDMLTLTNRQGALLAGRNQPRAKIVGKPLSQEAIEIASNPDAAMMNITDNGVQTQIYTGGNKPSAEL